MKPRILDGVGQPIAPPPPPMVAVAIVYPYPWGGQAFVCLDEDGTPYLSSVVENAELIYASDCNGPAEIANRAADPDGVREPAGAQLQGTRSGRRHRWASCRANRRDALPDARRAAVRGRGGGAEMTTMIIENDRWHGFLAKGDSPEIPGRISEESPANLKTPDPAED